MTTNAESTTHPKQLPVRTTVLPFVVVALVGQVIGVLSPGPIDWPDLSASTILLVAIAVAASLRIVRDSELGPVLILLAYVASVSFLEQAEGGSSSGSGVLVLIPLLAAALFYGYFETVCASAAVLASILSISLASHSATGDVVRRMVLWTAMCGLIAIVVHALRHRLHQLHDEAEDQAALEERRRIARDLHDGLAQELAFIATKARSVAFAGARGEGGELVRSADRALDEARRAIALLSATRPQQLAESLEQTAEDLSVRFDLPITVTTDEGIVLESSVCEHLLRIAREAISNAARHAHPTTIAVRLLGSPRVALIVEDDGCGFDPDGPHGGYGLVSMRERADAIGATLSIRSHPRDGTRVEVVLP